LHTLVEHALAEFPVDQPLTIRVNPADLAALKAAAGAAAGAASGGGPSGPASGGVALSSAAPDAARLFGERTVRWLPDARLAAGGCLVEGRERIVDGRVDTALERVYRRLAGPSS
jgi:flagellar biosynthesis/type III secretory pathway protein FliH